ncbi:endosomal peripheral membrane protein [Zymoseptoria brevis]|uniref:Endosomal peripheral membrane protein n=1 Tax=Zymoseptoria brevis TaxID=1047168 RepID=A0A0F4GHZ7_9PEZI|nr:endosomal peripheral membrane protein [Zymoseptoria brevis]
MSATLLANELSNLVSEAKRKNTDLRTAADKSLQDLRSLSSTSEQQLAVDLSRRPAFIEPFLIACGTRNPKFAGPGIICLQKLVIVKGLPKARLQDALEAFNACTDLGQDIQLKILQALPSLLANYGTDLEGDLLSSALQVCSSLQAAKASTVSGVAAATLQQLVTTVFEKVTSEDDNTDLNAGTTEVPGDNGPLHLKPAAFDAYRVFRDLALAADERKTKFVQFTSLSVDSSLELIWSCLDSNPELFGAHDELMSIIRANLFPLIIRVLSERLSFLVTLRLVRILRLILDSYLFDFPGDCEAALSLCTQCLESDVPAWKRALVMELLREFFADSSHVIDAYEVIDMREGGKPVVQDMISSFVRLSTEKPAVIGLGQQSTVPTGPTANAESSADQATLEAMGGMTGVIGSALGVLEVSIAGISSRWSLPRSPYMEQLDKTDAPAPPETYVYAMVLECLNGLSDSLARTVLPLTVQHEKSRNKGSNGSNNGRGRSQSFRTGAVPLNPLEAKDAPYAARVKAVAGIVDSCWPAVLATSSTFLNAALDEQYFRNLIKAYQRFAQVAGLLRLDTPRDAFMTTLAKAAVPPHVLNAATAETLRSPPAESPRVFSNPRALLSVDSFSTQNSSSSMEQSKRPSGEPVRPMLTVRNLLCLRALLNLAIALGPTLGSAFVVVVNALKQADMVLSRTTPQQMSRMNSASQHKEDSASVVQAFSAEVAAVEAAASRLLESTADYPNDAFMNVVGTFCRLLRGKSERPHSPVSSTPASGHSTPKSQGANRRTFSGLPGLSTMLELQARDYQFVIPKLGSLMQLNVSRFASEDPATSGWDALVDELTAVACSNSAPRDARKAATNVLVKLAEATVAEVTKEELEDRAIIQRRAWVILLRLIQETYQENADLTSTDLEVQSHALEALRTILERCGDTVVAGWDHIIAIISTAFEQEGGLPQSAGNGEIHIDWRNVSFDLVSSPIGRIAFAATQLVCSDFLDHLPMNDIPALIELLHRFMCQAENINAALTTITISWNVSDYLFGKFTTEELTAFIAEAADFDELEEDLQPLVERSRPAQWLLLLLRLRDVAGRPLKEIRNAAYQTVCNVFKQHGDELPPAAWDLLLRNTIFYIARADSSLYLQEDENPGGESQTSAKPDVDMSKTIIAGNFGVVSQHLRLIEQVAKLAGLWEVFLSMLERYLDVEDHSLNAAVYSALAKVLACIESSQTAWKGPIYRTVSLWLKRFPNPGDDSNAKASNQDAYLAYASSGEEIYRLTRDTMSTSQARTMIDNLYHCIRGSNGPLYGADTKNMGPLQNKVMLLLKSMRLDQHDIPACLVTVAAKLATLHHDTAPDSTGTNTQPTFVAMASEAIDWLQQLVIPHIVEGDLLESGALLQAVQSLRRVVESKYTFRLQHKGLPLWRRATSAAVALAEPVIEQAERSSTDQGSRNEIWTEYVGIISGVVRANDLHLVDATTTVHDDQMFDIESFNALQSVLIPRLGSSDLPDTIRLAYARALFEASLVHQSESGEVPGTDVSALMDIGTVRRGRVKEVPFSLREELAYVCWKELVSLASTPDASPERKSMARAAAPLLILRLAIPIRAYIADQPLRGRRPQPLSELEELLFAFETIQNLELDPEALKSDSVAAGRAGPRAHLHFLYPLLVQAVATAGDKWSGSEEVLAPLQKVLLSVTAAP